MFKENLKVAIVILVIAIGSVWFNLMIEKNKVDFIDAKVMERTDQRYTEIMDTLNRIEQEISKYEKTHSAN
jgi:hypothetical protein